MVDTLFEEEDISNEAKNEEEEYEEPPNIQKESIDEINGSILLIILELWDEIAFFTFMYALLWINIFIRPYSEISD
ncbi:hypothetical protein C1646_773721 [Rhizophagus diaphanus]|nr:hypothetical protein C1646_773721 [Rhizophagus diaphanus] [Rhizophagus sp. MUCL 43196]